MKDDSSTRHPVELLASELTQSLRDHKHETTERILTSLSRLANPVLPEYDQVHSDATGCEDEIFEDRHFEQLRSLSPVIEILEQARQSRVAEANSWASLGRDRPDRLGDFLLRHPIGRGGMGVVFEAWQESLGRTVALKILPRNLFADPTQRARFLREAKTIASLHHTNIVPIYGVGFDEGCHYFVMQRLEGCGVDQKLTQSGPMTPAVVAQLGCQAASALAYAHQHAVLHRDIKPSNLILGDCHELWVTDFGVAKTMESEAMTKEGDAVGTLRYMSPEQAIGKADRRSDIYSLGVTLYEMLAGRPALSDEDLARFLTRNAGTVMPLQLAKVRSDVPTDLACIIETAMASDPAARYQSAELLVDDLNRFSAGMPVSVRPLNAFQKGVRWSRQHPISAALSAALGIALLTLAVTMTVSSIALKNSVSEQQRARRSAERTAFLATEALGGIFHHFAPAYEMESGETDSTRAALNPAASEVLEELLPYYDSIADQLDSEDAIGNAMVAQSALNSLQTVADIQLQLGQYRDCVTTIDRALAQIRHSEPATAEQFVRQAHLENKASIALRFLREPEAALRRHEDLVERLQTLEVPVRESAMIEYEVARSHFLQAWVILPGMGPDHFPPPESLAERPSGRHPPDATVSPLQRRTHLNEAIRIASNLLATQTDVTSGTSIRMQRLLASALRERGRYPSRHDATAFLPRPPQGLGSDDWERSVDLLRGLVEQLPQNDSLKYELATTVSELNVFEQWRPRELSPGRGNNPPRRIVFRLDTYEARIKRLREAKDLLQGLAQRHPNVSRYSLSLIHTQFKLARMLERPHGKRPSADDSNSSVFSEFYHDTGIPIPTHETFIEAYELYQSAVQGQVRLSEMWPESDAYRVWTALFLEHLGETQGRLGREEASIATFTRLDKLWKRIGNHHHYDTSVVEDVLARIDKRLATTGT